MPKIDRLFEILRKNEGSDLHMLEGQKPKIRRHGRLIPLDSELVLSRGMITEYLKEICAAQTWKKFLERLDLDFAYTLDENTRFRCNYYHQVHGLGAVFRTIPARILTLEELRLPPVLRTFMNLRSGLVLVNGPTGAGKSTTLAAILDEINRRDSRYILTIEEPVEFVHQNQKSVFCQREVGLDVRTFAEALRSASRQAVDVILVGEMRDLETISLTLSAAAMGTLVFATLHTNSAVKTVDRIVDVFPPDQHAKARAMLADSLRGICSQLLLRRKDGQGRIPAVEVLLATQGLANSIRDGNTSNIMNIIQGGRNNGMQLMDDEIEKLFKSGQVSGEEAYLKSADKKRFMAYAPK